MLRGLFAPRSREAEAKETARAVTTVEIGIVAGTLGPLVTSAVVCVLLAGPRVGALLLAIFVLLVIGQMVGLFGLAQRLDIGPMHRRLVKLPLRSVGADGSVAVFEGQAVAGPGGLLEAPLSKKACLWAIVDIEISSTVDGKKVTRNQRVERAATFRVELPDGTSALVDPDDGDVWSVESDPPPPEEQMRAFAREQGVVLGADEHVWLREQRLALGTKVFVVGVVRRAADGTAYRGGDDTPTIVSDADTAVTVSAVSRAELLQSTAPPGVGGYYVVSASCIGLALILAWLDHGR